jgi:NTP pyrophosphatase (non-canonical NTP hydrolase)
MSAQNKSITELQAAILEVVEERDWQQFHSLKNVAMNIAVEAAELLRIFQWRSDSQSDELAAEERKAIALELGDVLIGCLEICARLNLDPHEVIADKLEEIRNKYPLPDFRGRYRI